MVHLVGEVRDILGPVEGAKVAFRSKADYPVAEGIMVSSPAQVTTKDGKVSADLDEGPAVMMVQAPGDSFYREFPMIVKSGDSLNNALVRGGLESKPDTPLIEVEGPKGPPGPPGPQGEQWSKGSLDFDTDLNSITESGYYEVGAYNVAASLKNLPDFDGAINSGSLEVFGLRAGACNQRWTVTGPSHRPSYMFIRSRDTAGDWSEWEEIWTSTDWEKSEIPKGADLNDYYSTSGVYSIVTYSVANSLINRPEVSSAVQPAVLEVLSLRKGQAVQRWTSLGAVGGENPVLQRTRDNADSWSEWSVVGGVDDEDIASPLSQVNASRSSQMSDRGLIRLLLRGEEGTPVWGWTAPPGDRLDIPTHDGSGQAVHPSVLYFKDGWHGWKYWMAMTPYPNFNEAHEDPNIVVSNDGTKWQVPDGLTNPIDDAKGRPDPYNSDAHLTMKGDTMVLTWRMVDRPNKGRESFWMVTSKDGVHWSDKVKIWWPELKERHSSTVAQSLLWVGDRWRLYFISTTVSPNQLVWVESTKEVPTPSDWGEAHECSMDFELPYDRDFWHSEIQYRDGEYWGIVSDANRRTTGVNGVIYLLHSTEGTTWEVSPIPLVPQAGENHDSLYKTGFVLSGSGKSMTIDVFYSAYDRKTREWGTWRTLARYAGPTTEGFSAGDVNVEWRGDSLVVNGKPSPSLTGPRGEPGPKGDQGPKGFVEPGEIVPLPRESIDLSGRLGSNVDEGKVEFYAQGGTCYLSIGVRPNKGGTFTLMSGDIIPSKYHPPIWAYATASSTDDKDVALVTFSGNKLWMSGISSPGSLYRVSLTWNTSNDVSAMSGPTGPTGPPGPKGEVTKEQLNSAIAAEKSRTVGVTWTVSKDSEVNGKAKSAQVGDFIYVTESNTYYKVTSSGVSVDKYGVRTLAASTDPNSNRNPNQWLDNGDLWAGSSWARVSPPAGKWLIEIINLHDFAADLYVEGSKVTSVAEGSSSYIAEFEASKKSDVYVQIPGDNHYKPVVLRFTPL